MITIEKTEVYGWEAAIRGLRNPMNSWGKSDSTFGETPHLGENDLGLMRKLYAAGSDHRKYLRYINVTADVTAPLYWWSEYDTYKVGTVANSCSKMHTIQKSPITVESFSNDGISREGRERMVRLAAECELLRQKFNQTGSMETWRELIQLLPESFNQRRTVQTNYEVLVNQYFARREHKLTEWHTYCDWIKTLPYFCEFCGITDEDIANG